MKNVWVICRKELRSYFASPIAYAVMALFALIFGLVSYSATREFVNFAFRSQMNGGGPPMSVNEYIIRPLLGFAGTVSLFLIPLISMRLIAEEKRNGTIELLLTSPIEDFSIILGKWLGAMLLYIFVLGMSLPNIAFLFAWGKPDWKPVLVAYLGLILQGGCLLAIGILISAMTSNQIVAGGAGFFVSLLLYMLSVFILVVLLVLVAINFLANRYDKSYDSTANKQFSLSDQTIKVVKGLKRDVQFNYFGPQNEFRVARDTLDRYSSLSPKLRITYIDPERKPQIAKAAGYRSDSTAIVDSGTRRESAKSLSEEDLTGALIRSLKSDERTVCVLSAAGERSIDDSDAGGYSLFKQLLERDNYKVRTETLRPAASSDNKPLALGQTPTTSSFEVPKSCTVLVIAGLKNDYSVP